MIKHEGEMFVKLVRENNEIHQCAGGYFWEPKQNGAPGIGR